jgi:hypothetical protein
LRDAYSTAEWTELFLAQAGASAALAGLLFVAISINLDRILKGSGRLAPHWSFVPANDDPPLELGERQGRGFGRDRVAFAA